MTTEQILIEHLGTTWWANTDTNQKTVLLDRLQDEWGCDVMPAYDRLYRDVSKLIYEKVPVARELVFKLFMGSVTKIICDLGLVRSRI